MTAPTELRARMQAMHIERPSWDEWPSGPWLLTVCGREWATSTDGHVLILVERERIAGELPPAPAKVALMTAKWLGVEPLATHDITADVLVTFTGAGSSLPDCTICHNTRISECEDCAGMGNISCTCASCGHDHDADCDTCDGKGKVECSCVPPLRAGYARFCGGLVNRQVLRRVVEVVNPTGGVTVKPMNLTPKPQSDVECFRFDGEGWMALVMGLMRYAEAKADFAKPETWAA